MLKVEQQTSPVFYSGSVLAITLYYHNLEDRPTKKTFCFCLFAQVEQSRECKINY